MNTKTILIISGAILLAIILFWRWLHHPLPRYEGEISLSGLKESVDIYTDEYGVPHVFAKNENDLFFTAGYRVLRESWILPRRIPCSWRELNSAG